MDTIKEKLADLIAASNADLSPQATHVLLNWKVNIWNISQANMPVVTLKFGPSPITNYHYGRGGTTRGYYILYSFTAHIWAVRGSGSTQHMKNASDYANDIIEYLIKNNKDETSGIRDIINLIPRESQPDKGSRRYSRVILTGNVVAFKPFAS